jgi:hypothetical protein
MLPEGWGRTTFDAAVWVVVPDPEFGREGGARTRDLSDYESAALTS